jgi:hypothetical protein
MWLGDLMDCGVDLNVYGQREQELHKECLSNLDFKGWMVKNDGEAISVFWRLASFTYGSSPSDWHVVVKQRVEEPVGDSDQMKSIPGGWVED